MSVPNASELCRPIPTPHVVRQFYLRYGWGWEPFCAEGEAALRDVILIPANCEIQPLDSLTGTCIDWSTPVGALAGRMLEVKASGKGGSGKGGSSAAMSETKVTTDAVCSSCTSFLSSTPYFASENL